MSVTDDFESRRTPKHLTDKEVKARFHRADVAPPHQTATRRSGMAL